MVEMAFGPTGGWPESETKSGVSYNDQNAPKSQTRCEDDKALNKVREVQENCPSGVGESSGRQHLAQLHLEATTSDSVTTVLRRQSERCRLTRSIEPLTHPVTLCESE
jgi:cysteine synthase